jgi:hypothetical protein
VNKRFIPLSPHANGLEIEYIHAAAFEISKTVTPPILRRTLSQYLQGYMQKHISHIELQYPQTMMLVEQKESGILGLEADVRKRKSGVVAKLEAISFQIHENQ